jgi:hypothetical protein
MPVLSALEKLSLLKASFVLSLVRTAAPVLGSAVE